jgi:hypothetical protein
VEESHRLRTGVLIGVAVVLLFAVGWVGSRALIAKDSLEHAQSLIGQIKDLAKARDIAGIQQTAKQLAHDTATAAAATGDPVWRVAEFVPVLGSNLAAVRELADVVDSISTEALAPLLKDTQGGLDAFKPKDGRFDIDLISRVAKDVDAANATLIQSSTQVGKIDTSLTVGPVTAAVQKLAGLLDKARPAVKMAADAASLLPGALGADGPRNYILLFQNNAESDSLGGNTAAWVILNVDDGALKITAQPSSKDFARDQAIPIELPQELLDLYNPDYFRYATNTTLRPDFPTAARLARAFWLRQSGDDVDGVVALDPIGLSYFLNATGPLALSDGQTMSADNAVSLLLSDVYKIFENPDDQDAFFSSAASTVFHALTSSAPDTNKLIDATIKAITDNRLMVWSAHPKEQAIIAQTQMAGILDTTNEKRTQVGVFYVENSGSKMSYYLKTSATISTTVCQPDQPPSFTVTTTLHSDISPSDYDALSAYVRSGVYFDPVMTRTLVFVYGPPGATYDSWSWDGASLGAVLIATGMDLGRPVAQVTVDLAPGDASTIGVKFVAPSPQTWGPLAARVTPMVNPTAVTLDSPGCAVPAG